MKKLFLLLLLTVVFCAPALAQKGMSGIGLNASTNITDGFGIGGSIKYQYNMTNYFFHFKVPLYI